jgi:Smr domain
MSDGLPVGRLVAIDRAPGDSEAHAAEPVRVPIGWLGVRLVVEALPLADLPPGTRLRVGDEVVLTLAAAGDADGEGPWGGLEEHAQQRTYVPAHVDAAGAVGPGDPVVIESVPIPVEAALDLHAFRPEEVTDVVQTYLAAARDAGLGEVRLIHGRGRGIQRETVRRVLAGSPLVAAFDDAPPERGGWGATLVRLRPRACSSKADAQ